jgi:hypothetical protein
MNIIETEAIEFLDDLYNAGDHNTLENLTDRISSKVYHFKRERDQLEFLRTLLTLSENEKRNHEKDCTNKNCDFSIERERGKFAIEQNIDEIEEYYTYEAKPKEKFTTEEESELNEKLNVIIQKLNDQGLGQEILFEEINSLKDHFNLGKRNWFQLLKGKLFDLTVEKILEKTVVEEIYKTLSDGYGEFVKLIGY